MKLEISGFTGANFYADKSLISPEQMTLSFNQKPGTGDFRPWFKPSQFGDQTFSANSSGILKFVNCNGKTFWSHESISVVNVDSFGFIISMNESKKIINIQAEEQVPEYKNISPTTVATHLGLPQSNKPTVGISEGTIPSTSESFSFVVTLVDSLGHESAPSEPSNTFNVSHDWSGGVAVAFQYIPLLNNRPIVGGRLYKLWIQPDGSYQYHRVILNGTPLQVAPDSQGNIQFLGLSDTAISPGFVLATQGWLPLGTGSHHITSLWNGIYACLNGKNVKFCVAGAPYAWPYELELDDECVSCAVYQQSLIVVTKGKPYLITGASPGDMNAMKLELGDACVQPDTCISVGHGVVWMSANGVCYSGLGGTKNITSSLIHEDHFKSWILGGGYYSANNWSASSWDGIVYFSTALQTEDLLELAERPDGMLPWFQVEQKFSSRAGFFINPANPTGIFPVSYPASSAFSINENSDLIVWNSQDKKLYRWNGSGPHGAMMTAYGRSRSYRMPRPLRFSCIEAISTSDYADFVVRDPNVSVLIQADGGSTHTTIEGLTNRKILRVPSLQRCLEFLISWETEVPVQTIRLGEAMTDLNYG